LANLLPKNTAKSDYINYKRINVNYSVLNWRIRSKQFR